jgi:hypothetical protein
MRKNLIEERTVLVEGRPLRQLPLPKSMGRRGIQLVENNLNEYDVDYDNFFEFQKDLDELEAANEQARKAEIYGEEASSITSDIDIKAATSIRREPTPIIMDEEDDLEISPIIMDEFEEIIDDLQFKRCAFVKENGEQCKRQAPKIGDFCAAHRHK